MTVAMAIDLAQRRLNDFQQQCGDYGDTALHLAYHAALPVVLNAELLHFLRINFFLDPPEILPYTVEFEFLLSPLCREIDEGLYEIEPDIRDVLLAGLTQAYGSQRTRDIATLLWQYVDHHSPWTDRVELERAQQLTALNFLDPEKAQQWLATVETEVSRGQSATREWFVAMRQEIENQAQLQQEPEPQEFASQVQQLQQEPGSQEPINNLFEQLASDPLVQAIFENPPRSDIRWADVIDLFGRLGAVQEYDDRVVVLIPSWQGSESVRGLLHRRKRQLDMSPSTVKDVQDLLMGAGVQPLTLAEKSVADKSARQEVGYQEQLETAIYLNQKNKSTLNAIREIPPRSDIPWVDIIDLLSAIGIVKEYDDRVFVLIRHNQESKVGVLHRRKKQRNASPSTIKDLQDLLMTVDDLVDVSVDNRLDKLGESLPDSEEQSFTINPKPIKIFISYSHKDGELRDELTIHLNNLYRQGMIQSWHDRAIEAGAEWNAEIKHQLETAEIILLLITPRFIASEYCYGLEMQRAVQRHDEGRARVIPIIAKPCDWQSTPFSKLQVLPKDARPIATWKNRDEAFLNVAEGIHKVAEQIMQRSQSASSKLTSEQRRKLEKDQVKLQEKYSLLNRQFQHLQRDYAVEKNAARRSVLQRQIEKVDLDLEQLKTSLEQIDQQLV